MKRKFPDSEFVSALRWNGPAKGLFATRFFGTSGKGGWRRVNLPGFPYYIAYVIIDELILVLAVAHAARHPNYWKERLP